ncbi:amino acid racemase [Vibrio hannami]|uniref:aspartate/glutamate racemase family protein n=1 Tax=Vibrio hannami TaxID=2717094 RepID=UPI0024105915|nr:amino acid racemase [Vibrio hannami]MDG3084833.1 amino acid racemase [Vibrio hannami]
MSKMLGVLGGMGPMATVDFVKRIVEKSPAQSDQEHIPMIISNNPIIPDRTKCILEQGEDPLNTMLNNLMSLKQSGATRMVIPCNTAHYWLNKLSKTDVPFISIIDAVIQEASRRKMKKIGILATTATAKTGIYSEAITQAGMDYLLPDEIDQQQVMDGIYAVKAGRILEGKDLMEPVLDQLVKQGADGVILGCTEIPLAFDTIADYKKSISLDSLDLLANKCVEYYYH